MNWHYVENGQQRGPHTEEEFQSLVTAGAIRPDTLIWREGLSEWKTYASQFQSAASASLPSANEAVCSECGRMYPADEVIRHGNSIVCAACKPIFLQKIKEGVTVRGVMVYAGFWIRFGAKFVDGIIQQVVNYATGFAVALAFGQDTSMMVVVAVAVLNLLFQAAYTTYFIGKFGATPGKMVAKIRVVNSDGSPVGYGKACGRYFAEILSSLTLGIGYIIAAFDDEKRALHDRICNTRVIKK